MLHYITVPVTPFSQNCSAIWCDEATIAASVDPGGDIDKLLIAVNKTGSKLEKIWLTHAHIDHARATSELAAILKTPTIGPHKEDKFWIDQLPEQGAMFGAERQSNPYVGGT